jgi:hypothetical protein
VEAIQSPGAFPNDRADDHSDDRRELGGLPGHFELTFKVASHTYRLVSTVPYSLAISPARSATLDGRARIEDVTDPEHAVDDGALLQQTLTDRPTGDTPDNSDEAHVGGPGTLSLTAWRKPGGLWFASDWTGIPSKEEGLTRGQVRIDLHQ